VSLNHPTWSANLELHTARRIGPSIQGIWESSPKVRRSKAAEGDCLLHNSEKKGAQCYDGTLVIVPSSTVTDVDPVDSTTVCFKLISQTSPKIWDSLRS
jgi:hypothetical protein